MADLVVLEVKLHGFSTAIKKAEDKEAANNKSITEKKLRNERLKK
jgi:hypothetical protein